MTTSNFDISVPSENQPSAYLSLLVSNLAHTQAIQMQLAEVIGLLKNQGDRHLPTLEYYQNLSDKIGEEIRASILAKWGE